jgi:hypothetical protein
MSETVKPFAITPARQVILNALRGGSLAWTKLREAYFGPERAKGGASTAFHMQLTKMIEHGLVSKDAAKVYSLTDAGREAITNLENQGVDLSLAVTAASRNAPTIKPKKAKVVAPAA